MWAAWSTTSWRWGRSSAGWAAQYLAWASTIEMPVPSSTAEDHGPSWCDPTITISSSAPGSSPMTLLVSISSNVAFATSLTVTSPAASSSSSQAPSLPRT